MALSGVRGGTTANEASYSYIAGVIGKTTTTQKISGLVNKVNITVSATFNDANSRPYIAGCVAQTAGELENCTNLGTIETTADFVTKASLYVGGVTWYAAHLTSCVNGSANSGEIQVLGAITIKGAVSRISYIGGVTSNNTGTTMEIHGCKNYGKLNVEVDNISTGSGHYVAAACIAASYNNVKALVECENYGNLNCKFKTKNTAGASYIGGIAAGNTQDALRSVLDCSNHGDITIDGSGVQTTVMVGGIMNIFETPSTHHNLTNTGDISINNYASKKDGYIIAGGITGRINDAGAKLTGSIVNTGAITLSGTLNHANGKTIHVGGIAGRMNALPAEASATFANSGAITFDGTSNSNINLGGIFGSCDTNITLNAKNTGNITCTGTVADGKEAYVGGIVGGYDTTRGALSGARCFCTLKAIGYENVGMVTGLAYDPAAEPFTNCHIGGKIATTIDSVANTPNWTPLDDWSFIDFIYGEPISTEQATAGKLGWLERNVDDTPIGADGTPIVEQ